MANVTFTLTANSQQAAAAVLQLVGSVNQLTTALRNAGQVGATSGGRINSGWAVLPGTIGRTIMQLAGIGTPLAAAAAAVRAIRSEYDDFIKRSKEAEKAGVRRAVSFQDVSEAFQFTEAELDTYQQAVRDASTASGLLVDTINKSVLQVAAAGASEGRDVDAFETIQSLLAASGFRPGATARQDFGTLASSALATSDIAQALKISRIEAAALVREGFRQSRAQDPDVVTKFIIPRVLATLEASKTSRKLEGEELEKEFKFLFGFFAGLSRAAKDARGRISSRGASQFGQNLMRFVTEQTGQQVTAAEAIKLLERDAALRRKFSGVAGLSPNATKQEIEQAIAAAGGSQGGEAILRPLLAAMVQPGSDLNKDFRAVVERLSDPSLTAKSLEAADAARDSDAGLAATNKNRSDIIRQNREISDERAGRTQGLITDLVEIQKTADIGAIQRGYDSFLLNLRRLTHGEEAQRRHVLLEALSARTRFLRRETNDNVSSRADLENRVGGLSEENITKLDLIDESIGLLIESLQDLGTNLQGIEIPTRITSDDRPTSAVPSPSSVELQSEGP